MSESSRALPKGAILDGGSPLFFSVAEFYRRASFQGTGDNVTKHRSWIAIFLLVSAASCGGGAADEGDTGDDTATTGGGEQTETTAETDEQAQLRAMVQELIVAPEQPWSEMSHEDKGTDMVMRFEPVFRVMFQGHDAEEFDHFGCPTCHGDDAEEVEYRMPSAHLPPVPMAGTPEYQEMAEHEPEMTRFMEEDVTPAMQTMLGVGATFTCQGCHPAAE